MGGTDARSAALPSSVHSGIDRRGRSSRARARRRAAEDALLDAMLLPAEPPSEEVGSEGQVLLTRALARLARQEDVGAAVAWSPDATGGLRVLAAQPADAARRIPPTRPLYEAVAALTEPTALVEAEVLPPLDALTSRGVGAVAPIAGLGGRAAAALLVLPVTPGRPLRPRTLAVLSEVTGQLGESLSVRLALDRLGRLDAAVRRLDRLAALGDLAAEIVHEVRNPLVSVKTFLQLLPDRLSDPEFHDGFRSLVLDEVQRLERMLEDLLCQARPGAGREAGDDGSVDGGRIGSVVETTLQLLTYRCRERGVLLETHIAPDLPATAASEDALRQLLLNLLLNATEVTPEGGTIRLVADWSEDEANHVVIRVDDSGPGIEPAVRTRVFEPFWTSRADGVGGLGLAICKRIVEEVEGAIRVEEGAKGGACFRIELPIAR